MSTPDDGAASAPDGGWHPGGQPAGHPGQGYAQGRYGQPPYGQPQPSPGQYGRPPYGQPPYGQPPYGQPGYGHPHGRPTNSLAIVSLVLAFVFAPAALVTGIIARRQIRETHEDGDGLALAGIIVGGIVTAFFVLFIVVWIIAAVSLANDTY